MTVLTKTRTKPSLLSKLSFLLFLSLYALLTFFSPALKSATVGINQIIAHPALDRTCQGICDELTQSPPRDNIPVTFQIENAQGQLTLAAQIAQKFSRSKAEVIVAIGTTAAQVTLKRTQSTTLPLVFSSVTDPQDAGLLKNLASPEGRITGVSNFIPLKEQLLLIKEMLPSLTHLGVLYNPGEANSVSLVKKLKDIGPALGVKIVEASALKTGDIPQAVRALQPQVQAILITNDNTALSAFRTIAKITTESKMPLFVSDTDIVAQGALAALGPDQYEIGRQTGRMVRLLLEGKLPRDIPVEYPQKIKLVLNHETAKKIGFLFQQKHLERAQ